MPDQRDALAAFFSPEAWRSSMEAFPNSGFSLVPEVVSLRPRFVVDAGCGYNEFKGRIPNLIGIDLVNPAADLVCDLEAAPIRDGAIDVILALGSVNFGSREVIARQLRVLRTWLREGGVMFMRGNPGEPVHETIELFAWSREHVRRFAVEIGFEVFRPVVEEELVREGKTLHRLCWAYRKT